MSVDVYIEAHRKVSETDLKFLVVYNGLVAIGIIPPIEITEYLRKVLGDDDRLDCREEIPTLPIKGMVVVNICGEGDVKYGNGMIIKIADLPPGTVALRIYKSI